MKAGERKEAAVAERADAPSHDPRLKLCRLETSQRNPGGPAQAMNNQDVGRERVAPDAEQCTPNDESDESKRNQTEPEGQMTKICQSRRPPTQDGDYKA